MPLVTLSASERLKPRSVIWSEVEICGGQSTRKYPRPLLSPKLFPLGLEVGASQPISCHQYCAVAIKLALTLYFEGGFRFRVVERTLAIMGQAFPCLTSLFPDHSSVRLWSHRLGLYRLESAKLGPRWTMICDHTATYGGIKLFVICGVDLDALDQRVVTKQGNYSLSHDDVHPLALVPMKTSNGEILLEEYLDCIEIHGHPEALVIDGGSDIQKSARLLNEHQENVGVDTTLSVYDISHRIARIIQSTLQPLEKWQCFETMVKDARNYTKYKARRHLSPPALSHGPDRWMNLSGIIKWYSGMLERRQLPSGDREANLRFGITDRVLEVGRATFRKCGKLFKSLESLCGKEHPDEKSFKEELEKKCPEMPLGMRTYLNDRKDLNETYIEEIMMGWEENQEIHKEVSGMLGFTNEIQKKIKKEGFYRGSVKECQEIYEEAGLSGVGEAVGTKVMDVLKEMSKNLRENQRIIATSDVLESLNGKWKMLIGGSATPALGSNALLMPALMGELDVNEIKQALETVKVEDVKEWRAATFGVTYHQEKRYKRPPNTS